LGAFRLSILDSITGTGKDSEFAQQFFLAGPSVQLTFDADSAAVATAGTVASVVCDVLVFVMGTIIVVVDGRVAPAADMIEVVVTTRTVTGYPGVLGKTAEAGDVVLILSCRAVSLCVALVIGTTGVLTGSENPATAVVASPAPFFA
jgi:hypothetical protein